MATELDRTKRRALEAITVIAQEVRLADPALSAILSALARCSAKPKEVIELTELSAAQMNGVKRVEVLNPNGGLDLVTREEALELLVKHFHFIIESSEAEMFRYIAFPAIADAKRLIPDRPGVIRLLNVKARRDA